MQVEAKQCNCMAQLSLTAHTQVKGTAHTRVKGTEQAVARYPAPIIWVYLPTCWVQDKLFKGYQMSTYNQILYTTLWSSLLSAFGGCLDSTLQQIHIL